MNLRRTFLALGAMILGVGFLGTSPAHAVVNCVNISVGTQWPDTHWTQRCGASLAANGTLMNAAAGSTHGTATDELRRANNGYLNWTNGVRFYLFASPAEYQSLLRRQSRRLGCRSMECAVMRHSLVRNTSSSARWNTCQRSDGTSRKAAS